MKAEPPVSSSSPRPAPAAWRTADAAIVTVIAIATLPLWMRRVDFIWDSADYHFPAFTFAARAIRLGTLPTWDPFTVCGMPFFADPQNMLYLNPIAILLELAIPRTSTGFTLLWLVVWITGALGASRLARTLGAAPAGAAFAGIAYGLSGYYVGHASNLIFLVVPSAMPRAMALAHEAVDRRSIARAAAAGIAFGTASWGGYPGLMIFSGIAIAAWLILSFLAPGGGYGRQAPRLPSRIAWIAVVTAIVGAIALVMWSPSLYAFFREGRSFTDRTGPLPREIAIGENAFSLPAAASVFFPYLVIAGRQAFVADITMNNAYLGALTVPLAVFWWAREPRRRLWLAVFVVVSFLLCLGDAGAIRGLLYDYFPPTRYTRHPGLLRIFWMLAIAVAGGAGLSALQDSRSKRLARWIGLAWGALALVTALVLHRWLGARGVEVSWDRLLLAPAAAIALGGILLATWPTFPRGLAPYCAVLLLSVDAVWQLRANAFTAWAPVPSLVGMVEDSPLRGAPGQPRVVQLPGTGPMNAQQILQIPIVRGYTPLASATFSKILAGPFGEQALTQPFWLAPTGGFAEVLARARFWIAPGVTPAATTEAALDMLARVKPGGPVPLIVVGVPASAGEPVVPGTYGTVRTVGYGSNEIRLDVEVPARGGWLASTERFSTGWRATVDGAPARIERVNLVFRGHALAPGHHVIVWSFDPGSWWPLVILGWSMFAAGAASALAMAFGHRREDS